METIEDTLEDEYAIASFLTMSGQHHVSGQYEKLTAQYGDTLEPVLSLEIDDEEAQYELSIDHEIERKGQRSGKGTQIVSRLIGRRHDWPQTFTGDLDPEQAANAYESVIEEA